MAKAIPQLLYHWERDLVPIIQEAGSVLGLVLTSAENLPSLGIEPQIAQPVVSHNTDHTILAVSSLCKATVMYQSSVCDR